MHSECIHFVVLAPKTNICVFISKINVYNISCTTMRQHSIKSSPLTYFCHIETRMLTTALCFRFAGVVVIAGFEFVAAVYCFAVTVHWPNYGVVAVVALRFT